MTVEDEAHVDIRRFQSDDGERIRELNEAAMTTTPEYVPDAPDKDLQDIHRSYLDSGGEFLVGIADSTIVGMGAYSTPDEWWEESVDVDDRTAELTRMRVDPEWHRRGIGTPLYRALEQRARDDGYNQFVLNTGAENNAARRFYESLDFRLQEELSVEVEDTVIELMLYKKTLDL